jgi:hypothetical protein
VSNVHKFTTKQLKKKKNKSENVDFPHFISSEFPPNPKRRQFSKFKKKIQTAAVWREPKVPNYPPKLSGQTGPSLERPVQLKEREREI